MRTLDTSEDDFRATPWAYPGSGPGYGVLLVDLAVAELWPRPGRRLGQSGVERATGGPDSLNAALLDANAAPVDQRSLVVSIGSNSSLAVMRRKFAAGRVSTVLPMVRSLLTGVAVGHSAHVSLPGYVPAAPFAHPEATTEVYAALLDDDQLRCLDETEPNYRRLLVAGADHELEVLGSDPSGSPSGLEKPQEFHLYVSRHGLVARPGGAPERLAGQSSVIAMLSDECRPLADLLGRGGPEEVMRRLADSPALRDEVRRVLADEGWVVDDGIGAPADVARRYGWTESRWGGSTAAVPGRLTCQPSRDDLDRRGEPSAVVHPEDAADLGIHDHAAVSSSHAPDRPGVVARVLLDPGVRRGTAEVDQAVRNGLGVEVGEAVDLRPATVPSTPLPDVVIARANYALLRVQTADLATVEQDVALLSPPTMSILGLEGGDAIVLEGTVDTSGAVRQVRLKAHAAPEKTVGQREALSGGGLATRFPGARSALGVHPDLPWIFLDSAARIRLGVGEHKLAVVRVRAARGSQVGREARELVLVLVVAFIGTAAAVKSEPLLVGFSVLLVVAAALALRQRIRGRLHAAAGRRRLSLLTLGSAWRRRRRTDPR